MKRINLNELKRGDLPSAIKESKTIYEIDLEGVGVIYTLNPPLKKSFTVLDELSIHIPLVTQEELLPGVTPEEYLATMINIKMRQYTTFMRESDEFVYGRLRFEVYSNRQQRLINKGLTFELGTWVRLYGTEDNPQPTSALAIDRLGSSKDDGYLNPETDILFFYREDSFLKYLGKQIY
jgi:hypothetical protein